MISRITITILFILTTTAYASPVPDTGQTKCYNNSAEIPCPTAGQDFYGQDAQYSINPMSYTKLDAIGNDLPITATTWAMVRDNVTGLVWENKTDDGSIHDKDNTYAWDKASSVFIAKLNADNFGGHSDWRLPTLEELGSIVDFSIPYTAAINTNYFKDTKASFYWSSSTDARYDIGYAWWGVDFDYGGDYSNNKTAASYVRAVRAGYSTIRSFDNLIINGDSTVTDPTTGLMWQQDTAKTATGSTTMVWRDALSYCENLNLGGYTDWRLPTVKELRTIMDISRCNPAIDKLYFKDTLWSFYWSSSTDAYDVSYAWCVDFNGGGSSSRAKTGPPGDLAKYILIGVRAVRGVQSVIESLDNLVISVSPNSRSVPNGSGTTSFNLTNTGTGTMNWTASVISGSEWLRITSGASGSNAGTIFCEFDLNSTTSARTATIRVTATGATGSPKDVTVVQEAGMTQIFSLTVNSTNGTVTKSPDKTAYNSGEVVTLTAVPASGYKFTSWSGDASGTSTTTTVTMTSNKTVSASFELLPPLTYTLTINSNHGTVTKTPNKTTYNAGESVTLTATPNTGYKFIGWSGDASGTSTTTTVTMTSNKSVIANFESIPVPEPEPEPTPEPEPQPTSGIGKAIIIAAGGAQKQNTLFKYTTEECQQMYGLLKNRGFADQDICYMTPISWQDINGDGKDDGVVDYQLFEPLNEITKAFDEAASGLSAQTSTNRQFVLYVHGHARQDNIMITQGNELSATKLKQLLSKIPSNVEQIVVLDTCFSGSFMDDLSSSSGRRIVLTSADADTSAWNAQYSSFSSKLVRSLRLGRSLGQAFYDTEDMILDNLSLFKGQRPQLDDTGDGKYSSSDGPLASALYIGGEGVTASDPPVITEVHPRIELAANSASTTLWVKTSLDSDGISKVRAMLIRPGFAPSDYQGEDTQFGREELEMLYSAPQKRFEVNYDKFREAGVWQILYQAQGIDGVWSDVASGSVIASGVTTGATIAVNLNQPSYKIGDQLMLSVTINGEQSVDLYVALMFPGGFFQTIIYPLNFSMVNSIMPYQTAIALSGEKTFPIMDFALPQGIPHGSYTCYGIVMLPGSDPWNTENWLHFDFKSFEM